jgi:anti-sigma regulatory factor (Ser/Thr protein kinase)
MTGQWQLQDCLDLGALPGAVPCARLHTRLVLAEWGLAGITEQAELLVSELVTNAVQASQSLPWARAVWLWLLADDKQLLIAVWDASPHLPVRSGVDELAESGRGLVLVDAVATRWDAYPTPDWGGKIVRAICAVTREA